MRRGLRRGGVAEVWEMRVIVEVRTRRCAARRKRCKKGSSYCRLPTDRQARTVTSFTFDKPTGLAYRTDTQA